VVNLVVFAYVLKATTKKEKNVVNFFCEKKCTAEEILATPMQLGLAEV